MPPSNLDESHGVLTKQDSVYQGREAWERRRASFIGVEHARVGGARISASAAKFGTVGVTFRTSKASDESEWGRALAALSCTIA